MDVVVFAVGNPSRGDDAIGPRLMAELEAAARPGIRLVDDFQLQVEHALDLDGAALALFIDAGTGTPAPFTFAEIEPRASRAVSSHALDPEAVLQVFRDVRQTAPPPAFVLCVRGESFELGAPLSGAAERHLAAAMQRLADCLGQPEAARWRQLAGKPTLTP
jgi:hydrogenase maturation protease